MLKMHESLYDLPLRKPPPRVVCVAVRTDTPYLTFGTAGPHVKRYAIIGTEYGPLHNTAGDIRLYRSESGARRRLRRSFY